MSHHGRLVVAYIDRLHQAELERIERDWWARYATTFTQPERTLIADGGGVFTRPRRSYLLKPELPLGEWIEARAHLEVKLSLTPAAKSYVYQVIERRDFRSHRVDMPRKHEDPDNMVTIVRLNDWPQDPPEPEKITASVVKELPESRANQQRYLREMGERRVELEGRPLAVRLAHVVQLAEASGVDLTRQLASVEQRIRAAESKVQRLAENASGRAA